jgi:hypothetical protein
VLVLLAGGFLLALLAAHVNPPHGADHPLTAGTYTPPTVSVVPPSGPPPSSPPPSRPFHEVGNLSVALYVLLIVGCVLAAVVLLVRALNARARRRRHDSDATDVRGFDLEPDLVATRMAEAAESGLTELEAEGPVADVIIACWQRLRAAAAEVGLPPVASDTPAEAIARVLRAGAVSAAASRPLDTLAGLYREARFSEHEMSRGDVWVARQALQAILAELAPETRDVR